MNNNEHWKFCVPGWAPEAITKDDRVCLLKETVQHNMDKQKEELLKIIDNAVNLKLKGKTITEWEETAAQRLEEIIRQKKVITKQGEELNSQGPEIANITLDGKSIIDWRKDAAYFRNVYEEARELAEKLQKEIDRLQNVVVERGAKLNRQGREIADRDRLKEESQQLRIEKESLQSEVFKLAQAMDSLFWIMNRGSKGGKP